MVDSRAMGLTRHRKNVDVTGLALATVSSKLIYPSCLQLAKCRHSSELELFGSVDSGSVGWKEARDLVWRVGFQISILHRCRKRER